MPEEPARLPLPALLSHCLVAFIIEFDNEFERRTPHCTSKSGRAGRRAPWLVSMAMWALFLRFVPEEGISARELMRLTGLDKAYLKQWLARLSRWWGYLTFQRRGEGWWVLPSAGGKLAIANWRPLEARIEERWRERFGGPEIDDLRGALEAVIGHLDARLPGFLPILGYGLVSPRAEAGEGDAGSGLATLLSKPLLAFALEFEEQSEVSLAICADVLRLTPNEGVRVRDLPRLAGVSKEAIEMATGYLKRHGYAAIQPEKAGSRVRALVLNARGRKARDGYARLVEEIEEHWRARFGEQTVAALRQVLEALERSDLMSGLEPPPENWRAAVPRPAVLPDYPMILHRGGYPDGS